MATLQPRNKKLESWGLSNNDQIKEIAIKAAHDDEKALQTVLEWVKSKKLANNISSWLGNPSEKDEIEQLTLLKIRQKINQYSGIGTFQGWVSVIARREALQLNRKQNQISTPVAHPNPELLNKKSAAFSSAIANQALINEALQELTPQQDAVFQMRLDGFSHTEIAKILGISKSASASTQNTARKKILAKIVESDPDLQATIIDLTD